MLLHLQELYGEQNRTVRYEISKQPFQSRMTEGTIVETHVLKMINLNDRLGQLRFVMNGELSKG